MTTRTHRLLPAILAAAAVALAGNAVGAAAVANAEREWDIGAYDNCMDDYAESPSAEEVKACCDVSGGVWNDDTGSCGAPPHPDYQRPVPPLVAPGAQTSATFEAEPDAPPTWMVRPGQVKQG